MVDGDWWYDARSGAYGRSGGACAGYARAVAGTLPRAGGPLRGDCSAGDTGVYVNDRRLDRREWDLWRSHVGAGTMSSPGRYVLDARGNLARELGGPVLANVDALKATYAGGHA
mmetsp:Transcript_7182/g.29854  ORF Transcript_7182/g.29854 Transcript_7182/m.29854 type:complete len:114 (+) Transcript_7182:312-653(+)